jgi:hypothetical protein
VNKYTIINNQKLLEEFVNFLPELLPNEMYYVSLLARNKYCPSIKGDKQQLKRFTSNKEFLIDKIKQLEVEVGSYKQRHLPIPQESLALYISINPRDLELATKNSLVEFANMITRTYDGYNPHQVVLTQIQKSCTRKLYHDFDFDVPESMVNETLNEIYEYVNEDACKVLITKNGFHVMVRYDKIEPEYKKTFFKGITGVNGCDVRGDSLIPVPGCTQGLFTPYFIKRFE